MNDQAVSPLPDIEAVSAAVHATWMDSKRAQGVTTRKAEDGEELMVPYDQLSEKAKQLDRGTVQAVYAAINAEPIGLVERAYERIIEEVADDLRLLESLQSMQDRDPRVSIGNPGTVGIHTDKVEKPFELPTLDGPTPCTDALVGQLGSVYDLTLANFARKLERLFWRERKSNLGLMGLLAKARASNESATATIKPQPPAEWTDWGGGDCPVDFNAAVDVRFRDGDTHSGEPAGNWIWGHSGQEDDVVAYKIADAADSTENK